MKTNLTPPRTPSALTCFTTEARSHREIQFEVFLRDSVSPWQSAGFCSVVQYNPMVPKDLLEILVCPAFKTELEYRQSPESLKCKQCHRVYLVKDDIPIMLIDEATTEVL